MEPMTAMMLMQGGSKVLGSAAQGSPGPSKYQKWAWNMISEAIKKGLPAGTKAGIKSSFNAARSDMASSMAARGVLGSAPSLHGQAGLAGQEAGVIAKTSADYVSGMQMALAQLAQTMPEKQESLLQKYGGKIPQVKAAKWVGKTVKRWF